MAAETGSVSTQAMAMSMPTLQRTAERRCTELTPKIAPVIVCVVLTGMPQFDNTTRVMAPAVSAQNPSTGRSLATPEVVERYQQ